MSEIIDFYSGGEDLKGRTLEYMWNFDYFALENVHDYIQYLFPITEPSYFNRGFPRLLTSDIRQFRNSQELKHNLLISFVVMLDFFGLKISAEEKITIEKAENYNERKDNWQTGRNHNFLRITRILTSLKLLGLEDVSLAFYWCLIRLVEEDPSGFNFISLEYWKAAVSELLINAMD